MKYEGCFGSEAERKFMPLTVTETPVPAGASHPPRREWTRDERLRLEGCSIRNAGS
jgi:hypothetical protein